MKIVGYCQKVHLLTNVTKQTKKMCFAIYVYTTSQKLLTFVTKGDTILYRVGCQKVYLMTVILFLNDIHEVCGRRSIRSFHIALVLPKTKFFSFPTF